MIEIEGPDGVIYEFPEGTSEDVMRTALMKVYGGAQPAQSPMQERIAAAKAGTLQMQPGSAESAAAADATALQGMGPERTMAETLYENIVGSGDVDTIGERLGQRALHLARPRRQTLVAFRPAGAQLAMLAGAGDDEHDRDRGEHEEDDQRGGEDPRESQAVDELRAGEPVVAADRALAQERDHGVGAALGIGDVLQGGDGAVLGEGGLQARNAAGIGLERLFIGTDGLAALATRDGHGDNFVCEGPAGDAGRVQAPLPYLQAKVTCSEAAVFVTQELMTMFGGTAAGTAPTVPGPVPAW